MNRLRLRAGAAAVVALALAGCATTSSDSGSADSSKLNVIIGNDINSLDPQAQSTTSVMQIVDMMVEELTSVDDTGAAKPELATKWSTSADGLTWTFQLRDNVTFSDGTPFDADAVKFSIDRLLSPRTYKAAPNELAVISKVTAVDKHTVTITTKQPFPALAQALSLPIAGIISPASATQGENTAEQIKKPVGTGPYVYSEYQSGDHITMTRNDRYWGDRPAYASQTYRFVTDASARLAALQAGDADVIASPPASALEQLQSSSTESLELFDSSYSVQIAFNTQDRNVAALNDARVRRALSRAVDRDTIVKKVLFGAGTILKSPLPTSVAGQCAVDMYGYDPGRARTLLAEAGASNLKLTMVSSDGRFLNDYSVAQAVAGYLRNVGVDVKLENPTDFTTYLSSVMVPPAKATSDLRLVGWGSIYLDASQALLQFRGDQVPPSGYNSTYFADAAYDKTVTTANGTIDDGQRNRLYCDAQKYIVGQAPTMWLYQVKNAVATRAGVTGVKGRANNMFVTTWAGPA